MTTLGEELPREMARVRDEVLPCYTSTYLKGAGEYAAEMMRHDLDLAAKALAEGDIVKMIAAYEALRGYHV